MNPNKGIFYGKNFLKIIPFRDYIADIRLKALLNWEELAHLLHTDKQTVCRWFSGFPVPQEFREHIYLVYNTILFIEKSTPSRTCQLLRYTNSLQLLCEGKYDLVKEICGKGEDPRPKLPTNQERLKAKKPLPLSCFLEEE